MIEKLETAGLGYYIKAESTQHKFGRLVLLHVSTQYLILEKIIILYQSWHQNIQ